MTNTNHPKLDNTTMPTNLLPNMFSPFPGETQCTWGLKRNFNLRPKILTKFIYIFIQNLYFLHYLDEKKLVFTIVSDTDFR